MIKPTVLFMFIIGLAGYNLLSKMHQTHWQLKRSSGYHTFFKSSAFGLGLFVIAILLYSVLVKCGYRYQDGEAWVSYLINLSFYKNFDASIESMLEVSILTLLLSFILPWVYYIPRNRKEDFRKSFYQDAESPELSWLFYQSNKTGIPVLFTMKDKKVYVGYIYEMQDGQFSDIYMLPIFGGFRDEKMGLHLVTPYEDVVSTLNAQEKKCYIERLKKSEFTGDFELEADKYIQHKNIWANFLVALPLREISHAHLHDFVHQNMFKDKEDSSDK